MRLGEPLVALCATTISILLANLFSPLPIYLHALTRLDLVRSVNL